MGIFNKLKEPVFLKEGSSSQLQIEKLKELELLLNEKGKEILKRDIRCLEYGAIGERNIAYELRNSHIPMYILHDIYLADGELSAQIDYLVFTKKVCFVIECKNLYGNVQITDKGDFIRTTEYEGKVIREGIYSPITQNQRHIDLMRKLRIDSKSNILTKSLEEKKFNDMYKSVIVLANPKTILNARYAPSSVQEKVIRVDQLVNYIKSAYNNATTTALSEEKLEELAKFYLHLHTASNVDYSEKYKTYIKGETEKPVTSEIKHEKKESVPNVQPEKKSEQIPVEESEIFKALKEYRLKKSREENIKPYYIYNDAQLKNLILKMPRSDSDLLEVSGFGEAKLKKYGADILRIVSQY